MTTTSNPSVKRRSPSEDSSDSSSQDRASPSTYISRQLSKQQIRHRASVACASCRERRIRCVVPEGDSECTQCKRTGAQCIIKNDDERRRPISKAYMSSLSSRITLLEGMLKERGVLPPPAIHPPKTRQEAQVQEREDSQTHDIPSTAESIQASSPERGAYTSVGSKAGEEIQVTNKLEKTYHPVESYPTESCFIEPALLHDANSRDGDRVRQLLLGAKGNFSFDGTCSRPQFFGSTANGHVYAGSGSLSQISSKEVPEQVLCTVRSIRSICSSTLDYLTACFWAHYDPTLQVVDRSAFEADRDSQNSNFYSEFLHIAILASGYKFADRDREDMKRLALGNWESTLHRETKHTANLELERPGGIPSVQALLLLSNLEYGVGRDTAGWMYSGMAIRLAFDIGLHVKCSSPMITEKERQIRRQVMTACVMFDRRWALLLGRPTSIKIQDIGFELTEESHHSLSSVNSLPPYQGIATDDLKRTDATARQQMVELMSLAARIADLQNTSHSTTDMYAMNELEDNAQLHVVTLDRQLQNWHRRLPGHLTWEPANIKSAPFSFFALHQQYHVCMILLHRPWAKYGPSEMDHELPKSPASIDDDNRVSLSRSICTQHAVRVARVFWQHRQRFDGRKMSSAGIQHAGTSAIALMAELAHGSKGLDHQSNLRYLQVLSAAIYDMSRVYQPAAKMYQLLRSVLADIRANLAVSSTVGPNAIIHHSSQTADGSRKVIFGPQQWNSTPGDVSYVLHPRYATSGAVDDGAPVFKKRRHMPSRRSSELAFPNPHFHSTFSYPTPPKSSQSHKTFGLGDRHDRHRSLDASSGISENYATFQFDFLNGVTDAGQDAVMDVDVDNCALASTPSADSSDDVAMLRPHDHGDETVDVTIEDWLAEPSGLDLAPSATKYSLGGKSVTLDLTKIGDGAANAISPIVGSPCSSRSSGGGSEENSGRPDFGSAEARFGFIADRDLDWMINVGGLIPMSLNDLVQNVENVTGSREKRSISPVVRNLDLDFLRL